MPGSGSGQERGFYDTPAAAGPAQIGVKPAVPYTAANMAASTKAQASSVKRNRLSDT